MLRPVLLPQRVVLESHWQSDAQRTEASARVALVRRRRPACPADDKVEGGLSLEAAVPMIVLQLRARVHQPLPRRVNAGRLLHAVLVP